MPIKKHYFVFACTFFFSLGTNILNFSLIYRLVDRFSFSPGQIGAYLALGQLFYFLGCNLYRRFASSLNPARIFPFAVVVVFLVSILLGFARSSFLVYAAYWVLQLSTGFYWPPVMGWLTGGLSGNELNREIGLFNRSWMAANILGPLAAGALYHWNSTANFFVLVLCFFTAILILFLLWRRNRKELRYRYRNGKSTFGRPAAPAASASSGAAASPNSAAPGKAGTFDKRLDLYRYRGWTNALCSNICMGIIVNILPLYIRDGLGFTERSAGMVLFFRSMAGFIGFSVLARFTLWHFNRKWFLITQGTLIFCTFLFLFAGNRLAFYTVVVFLFGFTHSCCYDNSIFYSGATGKDPKKNLALHEIFLSIGNAAGSAGGGFIYQHFRFGGTCFALVLVLGLGLGLLILLNKRERVPG